MPRVQLPKTIKLENGHTATIFIDTEVGRPDDSLVHVVDLRDRRTDAEALPPEAWAREYAEECPDLEGVDFLPFRR